MSDKNIRDLQLEIKRLKKELEDAKDALNKVAFEISDEQSICEIEIRRLRDISIQRPLTLEETKKFEILNKTLKSELGKKRTIPIQQNMVDTSVVELISMAEDESSQEK